MAKLLGERSFKQVIVVTGTPGVGKTSVSRQLAARLNGLHIDLGELVRREKLTSGYDRKRRTFVVDEIKLAVRLRHILKRQRGTVVIDGHYASAVVERSRVERVFILRRDPRQLKEMMEKRGFIGEKLYENLAAEVLDVILNEAIMNSGLEKICEIDTTNKTVDDSVNDIISILQSGKKCAVGVVDWIGKLEGEGVLDEYLR